MSVIRRSAAAKTQNASFGSRDLPSEAGRRVRGGNSAPFVINDFETNGAVREPR
jgi:hypothetical protein